jgi:hypothetical protein
MAKKKEVPVVSVLERRLQHPFGAPSIPITMRDRQQWATHWISSDLRAGRVHQAIKMGWVYVLPTDIDGTPDELGFDVKDNRIVRGTNGSEVLMKMPQADFHKIQHAKSEANLRNMGGKKLKADVAQRAASQFGDEAAETVYKSDFDVKDSRVNMDLEGDAPPAE